MKAGASLQLAGQRHVCNPGLPGLQTAGHHRVFLDTLRAEVAPMRVLRLQGQCPGWWQELTRLALAGPGPAPPICMEGMWLPLSSPGTGQGSLNRKENGEELACREGWIRTGNTWVPVRLGSSGRQAMAPGMLTSSHSFAA